MKRKLVIYALGLIALAAVWGFWYSRQSMSHDIRATRSFILVNAPADKVWQALIETQQYPEWNPYITRVDGTFQGGAKLHITERVGGRNHRHTVNVTQLTPSDHRFAWHGSFWPSPLLSWDEGFFLQSNPTNPNQTIVVVSRAYQGLLTPLYWKIFNAYDLEAIRQMGSALKQRCEK